MNKAEDEMNRIPEIYCAITVLFDENMDVVPIVHSLRQIGISKVEIIKPQYDSVICLSIATVDNERFWYLDEALSKMFSQVGGCLSGLKEVVIKSRGEIRIDIAFYQYGTYPALEFSGDNMKKIRFLEADISIAPY